jgi:plastocyanin
MKLAGCGLAVTLFAGSMAAVAVAEKPVPVAVTAAEKRATAVVGIENFRFSPAEVTVPVGAVVRWVNKDDVPHTVTAKGSGPAFDSKALDTEETFSFEFKQAGTYTYYCKVHPHMTAKIVVK